MNAWMRGAGIRGGMFFLAGAAWCASVRGQEPSKLGLPTTVPPPPEVKLPPLPPPAVLPDANPQQPNEETSETPGSPRLLLGPVAPVAPVGEKTPSAPARSGPLGTQGTPAAPGVPAPAAPTPPGAPGAPGAPPLFPKGAETPASIAPAAAKQDVSRQQASKQDAATKAAAANDQTKQDASKQDAAPAAPPEDVSLTAGRATLEETFERITDKLVFAPDDNFRLIFFGNLTGEMVFSTNRTLPEGAPAIVAPDFGDDRSTVEVHARSTAIGMFVVGPEICGFQSGGLVHFYLWGEEVVSDRYGIFVSQAFAELRNDQWRFAAGLQDDVLAPLAPGTINWTRGWLAGNAGYLRGQFRAERFFRPSPTSQVTITGALSEPVVRSFTPALAADEDNGWPNIEGRVAVALGPLGGCGLAARRPLEVGLSSVIGELRSSGIQDSTANVWALAVDGRWALTDRLGFQGEVIHGQAIGSYLGTAGQTSNVLGHGIRSTGGWGEVYWFWTPCLHSHVGWGVDNPRDRDLNFTQVRRNEFCFANLIWDVTRQFEVGFEVGYRETHYAFPRRDNEAVTFHTRVQLKF
jgi:hypothetical protein